MLTVGINSNYNMGLTGTMHLTSIAGQRRYTDGLIGCKNFTRTSFSSTETSSLIPSYYFFSYRQLTQLPIRKSSMEISFPFFEWKVGVSLAPLISLKMASYILMQSHSKMRQPGIVLDSKRT